MKSDLFKESNDVNEPEYFFFSDDPALVWHMVVTA